MLLYNFYQASPILSKNIKIVRQYLQLQFVKFKKAPPDEYLKATYILISLELLNLYNLKYYDSFAKYCGHTIIHSILSSCFNQ